MCGLCEFMYAFMYVQDNNTICCMLLVNNAAIRRVQRVLAGASRNGTEWQAGAMGRQSGGSKWVAMRRAAALVSGKCNVAGGRRVVCYGVNGVWAAYVQRQMQICCGRHGAGRWVMLWVRTASKCGSAAAAGLMGVGVRRRRHGCNVMLMRRVSAHGGVAVARYAWAACRCYGVMRHAGYAMSNVRDTIYVLVQHATGGVDTAYGARSCNWGLRNAASYARTQQGASGKGLAYAAAGNTAGLAALAGVCCSCKTAAGAVSKCNDGNGNGGQRRQRRRRRRRRANIRLASRVGRCKCGGCARLRRAVRVSAQRHGVDGGAMHATATMLCKHRTARRQRQASMHVQMTAGCKYGAWGGGGGNMCTNKYAGRVMSNRVSGWTGGSGACGGAALGWRRAIC